MPAPAVYHPFVTAEEYLEIERRAETRSEYLDGEMLAMTGASLSHNVIAGNLVGELRQQLKRRPCQVVAHDSVLTSR